MSDTVKTEVKETTGDAQVIESSKTAESQTEEKEPVIIIGKKILKHAQEQRRAAVAKMIAEAKTNPFPNLDDCNVSMYEPSVLEMVLDSVGQELPYELLVSEIQWTGPAGISAQKRQKIPQRLIEIQRQSMIEFAEAFNSSNPADVPNAVRHMMNRIHGVIPRAEHDAALAKTRVARFRKYLAEQLARESSRLERALCGEQSCGRVIVKHMKCGACGEISYCAKACQRLHWPEHKATCARIAELKAKGVESEDAWFVVRNEDGSKTFPISRGLRKILRPLCEGRSPNDKLFG